MSAATSSLEKGKWSRVRAIIDSVAQLVVRNLDENTVRALKERAAEHGRSAEEEHREILRRALNVPSPGFKAMLMSVPDVGDDADFARRDDLGRKTPF